MLRCAAFELCCFGVEEWQTCCVVMVWCIVMFMSCFMFHCVDFCCFVLHCFGVVLNRLHCVVVLWLPFAFFVVLHFWLFLFFWCGVLCCPVLCCLEVFFLLCCVVPR